MKKNIAKKIDRLLSLVIIGVLLPLFVTIICQRMQLEEIIYGEAQTANGETVNETEETDKQDNEQAEVQAIEQQVIGIVAKEISPNVEREALLSQCVIARTNLYDAREKNIAEPESLSLAEMKELWGENFEQIYAELERGVKETKNQVLMWNGDYIYAAYHALSAGRTRDMSRLYGEAKMPYLKEQLCKDDAVAEGYLSVNYWAREEFLAKCAELFPESVPKSIDELVVTSRDETGYVEEITVGGKTYTGEEFRSRFKLNSACFTITGIEEQVRIVTKGIGHGFGLSQNTAICMAKEGSTYEDILAYFYPGTELTEADVLK